MRDAAKLCRLVQEYYLIANTKTSGVHSEPVTIADYGSQAIICRALQTHYPDDAVVSEESGEQFLQLVSAEQRVQVLSLLAEVLRLTRQRSGTGLLARFRRRTGSAARTWVIDPIDGTKGFLAQRHYAIACGLLLEGQVAEGIVAAPGYDDGAGGALFYTRDGATFRAPLSRLATGSPVTVSARRAVDEFVAVQSFERAHASKSRMGRARELRRLGRCAHPRIWTAWRSTRLVACGDADLYMRLPRAGSSYAHKIWDHAAGVALVQAAGGTVTDLDGSPLDFSHGDTLPNPGMIISNGPHHQRVVEAVQQVMSE